MNIVSIGEILWDVFPDGERLGGAPLNFSAHSSRLGERVFFLSAVGDDERGREARRRAGELGLDPGLVQTVAGTPTGTVSVQVGAEGHPAFTIHRPAAYDCFHLEDALAQQLAAAAPEWVYYGTLHQAHPRARAETARLLEVLPSAQRFYDINLRPDCWSPELLEVLLRQSDAVKLNEDEAEVLDRLFGCRHASLAEFTASWSERMRWRAVAVTRGAAGCAVRMGSEYAEAPGFPIQVVDTVGSGDAFAAAFLHGLGQGWDPLRAGTFANRLGALVASRAGAVPAWTREECEVLPVPAPR